MKTIIFIVAVVASVGVAFAAKDYTPLAGTWTGTVTTNLQEETAGGNKREFSTGSGVELTFTQSGTALSGTCSVAGTDEEWKMDGDTFTWNDKTVTVTAKAIPPSEIPEWMRKQAGLTETDTPYAFKYSRCTINATKKACRLGTDIPEGVNKTGIYMLKVQEDKLLSGFYFTNSKGGKRIVERSLTAKK